MRGVPVITIGFDPNNIIKENDLGYVCTDAVDAARKINQLLSDEKLFKRYSENVTLYSNKNNSLDKLKSTFLKYI